MTEVQIQEKSPIKPMSGKKVIAICQSGGEFVTARDGSLSYSGGEAYAVDIDGETKLEDLKTELLEMFEIFGGGGEEMTIKYFLQGNKKTLISISKDKDLHRMLSFLGDSSTAELFVVPKDDKAIIAPVAAQEEHPQQENTVSSRTTVSVSGTEQGEPLNVAIELSGAPVTQEWESAITGLHQRFGSFGEFREALHKYSIAHGFAYRYKKSDSQRVTAMCKSEGCNWRISVSRVPTTHLVCVKRYNANHTCEGSAVEATYRATRGCVGNVIKEKLKVSPNYKPKDLARDVKRDFGISLNYSQAWRAKEIAREQLRGSYKEAYSHIPALCDKIIRTNPGSVASFSTNPDGSFHRLFLAFHACLCGLRLACRPLIFLHASPLNSRYQGVLLTATAPDPDDSPFPVAFAIADSDSDDNWRWFLAHLKATIDQTDASIASQSQNDAIVPATSAPAPTTSFTFVSSLPAQLPAEAFGECHHALCLRRLAEDLNRDLKGQLSHEARRFMVDDLYAAAHAPTPGDFTKNAESIRGISAEAYDWVVRSDPKRWANAFFPGARYNLSTSNFGYDELYAWASSDAHELPITQMIDLLRGKTMHMMHERRAASATWLTRLPPSKEERVERDSQAGRRLPVSPLSLDHNHNQDQNNPDQDIFEVGASEKVDLQAWQCSCNRWQLTGLPCIHALAAIHCTARSPYDFCSPYLTTQNYRLAYSHSIQPIPDLIDSPEDPLTVAVTVSPPPTKRPPGRPKTPKSDSIDVIKRQFQCSNCKGLGHNKKSCKR